VAPRGPTTGGTGGGGGPPSIKKCEAGMTEAKIYLGNLSYDARERDIEKFLKGYGYIRNISVKVAPPTSLEYHPGTFKVSKSLAPSQRQIAGTYSPSTFRKDTGLPSLKIVATQTMLSRSLTERRWTVGECGLSSPGTRAGTVAAAMEGASPLAPELDTGLLWRIFLRPLPGRTSRTT